ARAEPEEAPDREADGEAEPGLAAVAHRRGADAVDPRGRHPPREEAGACRGESRQSEEEDTEQNLMALRPISGPRLPPARGKATHLVVLCHGYGADGNDLIGLAPHWQQLLPTVAFAAPNKPRPHRRLFRHARRTAAATWRGCVARPSHPRRSGSDDPRRCAFRS